MIRQENKIYVQANQNKKEQAKSCDKEKIYKNASSEFRNYHNTILHTIGLRQ